VNPLVYRTVEPIERWLTHRPGIWRLLNRQAHSPSAGAPLEAGGPEVDLRHRAVIVGHGHVGRTVARLLQEQEIEPSIIEMNLATVQQLRQAGIEAFYGDATLRPTLEQAGVGTARTFVLSVSGFRGAEEAIRLAREINPRIHIIARTRYLSDIPALRRAGADRVFSGEGEVALAMTEYVLSDLGATPEQIDRERARVHEEPT
jgi:CPA2 family monovalent cation:H+ antiporter-2